MTWKSWLVYGLVGTVAILVGWQIGLFDDLIIVITYVLGMR